MSGYRPWDIGVCSWSLQPKKTADAVARAHKLGLNHLQLALRPLLFRDDKESIRERTAVATSGLAITAGMLDFPLEDSSSIESIQQTCGFSSDGDWDLRQLIVHQSAALAADLGINQITLQPGFISNHRDEAYTRLVGRVRKVANTMLDYRIDLLLENGPEYPDTLRRFLDDVACANLMVSLDVANCIIYGTGEPADAVEIFGKNLRQIQLRDAVPPNGGPDSWGKEVRMGEGALDLPSIMLALQEIKFTGHLLVERNVRKNYMAEISESIEIIRKSLPGSELPDEPF